MTRDADCIKRDVCSKAASGACPQDSHEAPGHAAADTIDPTTFTEYDGYRALPFHWRGNTLTVDQVGAEAGGEAYLIKERVSGTGRLTRGGSILIDTGYAYCAPQTLRMILDANDATAPDWLILTHSHYDHASAAGYLKQHMPSMRIACSEHAAHVFSRPGAIDTMRRLNDNQARIVGLREYEDVAVAIEPDCIVGEGDTIESGSLHVKVMRAIGHTKCSISLWFTDEQMLMACESNGVYAGPPPASVPAADAARFGTGACESVPESVKYMTEPSFLVDCKASLDVIDRSLSLKPSAMLLSHNGVFVGHDARDYLRSAKYWEQYAIRFTCAAHKAGLGNEEIAKLYKKVFYTETVHMIQPEMAFDLNTGYQIATVIQQYCTN